MKKIAIIGPESTGKSTLSRQLAAHYHTVWCPEYARAYLVQYGKDYTFGDLLTIAKGQKTLIEQTATGARNGLFFIDTEMYVMKVWCEVVFDNCHTWILKEAAHQRYDLILLCNTDLPWVSDELREYPDLRMRQRLFKMYKDICINGGMPWVEIGGQETERLQQAVKAVDRLMS